MCRKWNECTRCPVLWKKVDVKFPWRGGSQNEVTASFSKNLSTSVRYMKLDFKDLRYWKKPLNFEELCVKLQKLCPYLQKLILHHVKLSINLMSAIALCSHFLPNVELLAFRYSEITDYYRKRDYEGAISKIKVLDLCKCVYIREFRDPVFPKMPYLEILNLAYSTADGYWFQDDFSFLNQLHVLNASGTLIHSKAFETLKNHALNLTELYLCRTYVKDTDFTFDKSIFPHLKTVCLRRCFSVTSEGVVSLIQSCQSLEDIYVDEDMAESYAKHSFVVANRCKLKIVKIIHDCWHYCKID